MSIWIKLKTQTLQKNRGHEKNKENTARSREGVT